MCRASSATSVSACPMKESKLIDQYPTAHGADTDLADTAGQETGADTVQLVDSADSVAAGKAKSLSCFYIV